MSSSASEAGEPWSSWEQWEPSDAEPPEPAARGGLGGAEAAAEEDVGSALAVWPAAGEGGSPLPSLRGKGDPAASSEGGGSEEEPAGRAGAASGCIAAGQEGTPGAAAQEGGTSREESRPSGAASMERGEARGRADEMSLDRPPGSGGGEPPSPGGPPGTPAAPTAVAIRWTQGWSPMRGEASSVEVVPEAGANPQRPRACASAHGTGTGRPMALPRRRSVMVQRTTAKAEVHGRRARSRDSATERNPLEARTLVQVPAFDTEAGTPGRTPSLQGRRRGRAQPDFRIAGARIPPCFL